MTQRRPRQSRCALQCFEDEVEIDGTAVRARQLKRRPFTSVRVRVPKKGFESAQVCELRHRCCREADAARGHERGSSCVLAMTSPTFARPSLADFHCPAR